MAQRIPRRCHRVRATRQGTESVQGPERVQRCRVQAERIDRVVARTTDQGRNCIGCLALDQQSLRGLSPEEVVIVERRHELGRRSRIQSLWRCLTSAVVDDPRSEEHTSELQSQSNLVCRLLLEKKKRTN